jgi:hypothetical protein
MTDIRTRDELLSCTVVSLIPWVLKESKPGLYPGHYFIKPSDTKIPSIVHVTNKTVHFVYLDDTRGSMIARDPSDEVAKSIVNDFCNSQLGTDEEAKPGMFWVPGLLSVEEIMEQYGPELELARSQQIKWFTNICRIADDDWTRYHKHNVISDFQRLAATVIGWNPERHEWMNEKAEEEAPKTTQDMKKCIACFSIIEKEAKVCRFCRCIFPEAKESGLTFAN